MTFLVTFTFDSALFLELLACLSSLACVLVTIIMRRCFPITQMTLRFPIGCNGHVPDGYFPDVIKKNRLYPDLTIFIWLPAAKLHNSVLSSFRAICRKLFRKISEPTVGVVYRSCGFIVQTLSSQIILDLKLKGRKSIPDFCFGFCPVFELFKIHSHCSREKREKNGVEDISCNSRTNLSLLSWKLQYFGQILNHPKICGTIRFEF